jgi:hypothetical protein
MSDESKRDIVKNRIFYPAWLAVLFFGSAASYAQGPLYTEGPGSNPPFESIRNDISNGYSGTEIDVNNASVEGGLYGQFGIQNDLKIHTLASSVIGQNAFGNWSRWYQTDGATQVFRLFPDEENVRNSRALAARIEAFDTNTGWNVDDGEWNTWVGRYTIIDPINAAIFQVKDVDEEAWSLQINMNEDGRVYLQHRRPLSGQEKQVTLVENAIGQSFDIRVRDNGLDYELYLNDQSQPLTTGQYVRNADPGDNSDTKFRWGIYVGAKEVEREALIFVSHATVNPDLDFPIEPPVEPTEPGIVIAGWDTWGASASNVTDGTTVGTASSSGFSSDSDRRASTDGTWGSLDIPLADKTADENDDTVRLTNGSSGSYDFTLVDTGGIARDLTTFHFDAATFRPNSARNYELLVVSGDLTIGSVATGIVPSVVGGQQDWSDFDISLTGLSDRTLDANGTVTFRLEFTGGTLGAGGHHQSLDNVAVTAELPVAPSRLIAGWDTWDSATAPSSSVTEPGVTATATASAVGGTSNWSISDGGGDPGRGSSGDTSWGTFEGEGISASSLTNTGVANLTATNAKTEAEVTFTITNGSTADIELAAFHFDALAFRPKAPRSYSLSVLAGSDITVGNVFTSDAPMDDNGSNAITHLSGELSGHDQHDQIDLDLSALADSTLEVGGTVMFQLEFTNGAGDGSGGHHLFLDNVAVSGATTLLTGIQGWRLQHFGTVENSGDAADLFDADGDGESNLLEFATGQDPLVETEAVTGLMIKASDLEFRYLRGKIASAAGFIYRVEWSDSLLPGSWNTTGVIDVQDPENPGDNAVEHRLATVPKGAAGGRFVRLWVAQP